MNRLIFFLKTCEIRWRVIIPDLGKLKRLIPAPSEVARGSRNQGVIGGVVFYSEIINERADVICSVMTEWVCFRIGYSDPLISITKNLNNIIRYVEISHNVIINVKQNIKPVAGVLNAHEILY